MFSNYFRVVFRNLLKNKIYTSINVFGLSIGITCCLIIAFYTLQETNYDSFWTNKDKIYRVALDVKTPNRQEKVASTYIPLAAELTKKLPEIEEATKLFFMDRKLFKANEKIIFEDKITFADSNFFKVLDLPIKFGNTKNLLSSPDNVLISETIAKKYFGNSNAVGETMLYDNYKQFKVAAVFADIPHNSHLSLDFIIPFKNLYDKKIFSYTMDWGLMAKSYTYVKLNNNILINDLKSKSDIVLAEKLKDNPDISINLVFQKIDDIYLNSNFENEPSSYNSYSNIITIVTIGVFILLIASINYMNLASARATKRAKEVGVRKVLGAFKGQLVFQFLTESIILTFIAAIISLVLVEISLPVFSTLLMKNINIDYFSNIWIPIGILSFTIILGIISGSYPALYLSHFTPLKVLKSDTVTNSKNSSEIFRKVLVVTQFSICILLIIGMIIIKNQLSYMQNANMGFNKDHNIVIPLFDKTKTDNYTLIKNKLTHIEGISSVTACLSPVVNTQIGCSFFPNATNDDNSFNVDMNSIDYDYINHFDLKLLAGRNFSAEFTNDEAKNFIVTESIVKKLGFTNPDKIIGKEYKIGLNGIKGKIVGVVNDFHNGSLHSNKSPVVMLYWPYFMRRYVVKVNSDNISSTLKEIERTWKQIVPNYPFEYSFLDEKIDNFYKREAQTAETVTVFSIITLLIGCLGLFGLSAFSVEQKTKEIGIRKVVGASVSRIVFLLNKQFVKLILISNLIACPIAYYFMDLWLQDFPYRINIELWIFGGAAVLSLLVAILTVSYQSIKAALVNPVKSLKYE